MIIAETALMVAIAVLFIMLISGKIDHSNNAIANAVLSLGAVTVGRNNAFWLFMTVFWVVMFVLWSKEEKQ